MKLQKAAISFVASFELSKQLSKHFRYVYIEISVNGSQDSRGGSRNLIWGGANFRSGREFEGG